MTIQIKLVSPKSIKPGGVEYITWEVSGLSMDEAILDAQFSIDGCKTWNRAKIDRGWIKVLAAHPLAINPEGALTLAQPKTPFYVKVIKHPEEIIRGEYDIWLE
jgi:hypothetical protein